MMVPFPAIVGPTYQAPSRLAGNERCAGFYLEKNESPGAVYPFTLLPFPGLISRLTTTEGPGRGMFAQDGVLLSAQGHRLYSVDSAWTGTDKGAIARDDNPVTFASSGDAGAQAAIASAGSVYIYDLTGGTLGAAIVGLAGHQVGYLNGYFLALNRNTSTLRISNLLNGTTWDPTQFAQRSSGSDKWQGLLVSGDYIFLFGSETTDVWYNAGTSPFPFAPVAGARIPVGITAAWSAKNLLGIPVWLTQSADGARQVVRANGTGLPTRISTHAMELAMRDYSTVSDARACVVETTGHAFYRLSFPTAGATWVFDTASGQWTEDPYWNSTTGRESASLYADHAYAFGSHVVNDRRNGAIYTLSPTTYTHNGDTIRRVRRVPIPELAKDRSWITLSKLHLMCDTGIGLQVASGTVGYDPQVTCRVSRDSGYTWGSEIRVSAGKIGDYRKQVIFRRLGRFRDGQGVAEFVMTDPVPWRISGAALEAERGAA